jgi:hypothetical protein
MTAIAACAVWLSVLRQVPMIAFIIGPIIGSVWGVKKGRKGIIGGVIGGMTTYLGIGVFFLITTYYRGPAIHTGPTEISFILIIFAFYAIEGASIGLAEGIAFCFVRYLTTLPRDLRLRADMSAKAKNYRSTSDHTLNYAAHRAQFRKMDKDRGLPL